MLFIISSILLVFGIIYAIVKREPWLIIVGTLAMMATFFTAQYEEPDYRKELSKVPVESVVYVAKSNEYMVRYDYGAFEETATYKSADLNIIDSKQKNITEYNRHFTDHWIFPWDRTERGVSTLRYPLPDIEKVE